MSIGVGCEVQGAVCEGAAACVASGAVCEGVAAGVVSGSAADSSSAKLRNSCLIYAEAPSAEFTAGAAAGIASADSRGEREQTELRLASPPRYGGIFAMRSLCHASSTSGMRVLDGAGTRWHGSSGRHWLAHGCGGAKGIAKEGCGVMHPAVLLPRCFWLLLALGQPS